MLYETAHAIRLITYAFSQFCRRETTQISSQSVAGAGNKISITRLPRKSEFAIIPGEKSGGKQPNWNRVSISSTEILHSLFYERKLSLRYFPATAAALKPRSEKAHHTMKYMQQKATHGHGNVISVHCTVLTDLQYCLKSQ